MNFYKYIERLVAL